MATSLNREAAGAPRVSAALLTLTYGALVRQLLNDSEECVDDVNAVLERLYARGGA